MGSQTNRNLAAKAERANTQRRALATDEYSKPAYHVKATEYDATGVSVVRIEQPVKAVVRIAIVDPVCRTPHVPSWDVRTVKTEVLVNARIERARALTGKRAMAARLRQHF